MKHMKILKKLGLLFLSFALITTFASCDSEEPEPANNPILVKDIVATWVVDIDADGEPQAEHTTISTYNTSANGTDAMWLDDQGHGWGLKAKVNLNYDALTFSGTDLDELYYGVTVNITEGEIIKDAATTPSGEVVDSIYFKAEFSDIPGVIWEYYGYKSTAKPEDLP